MNEFLSQWSSALANQLCDSHLIHSYLSSILCFTSYSFFLTENFLPFSSGKMPEDARRVSRLLSGLKSVFVLFFCVSFDLPGVSEDPHYN